MRFSILVFSLLCVGSQGGDSNDLLKTHFPPANSSHKYSYNVTEYGRKGQDENRISDKNFDSHWEKDKVLERPRRLEDQPAYQVTYSTAVVDGLRIEGVGKGVSYNDEGVFTILADVPVKIRLFGRGFTNYTVVRFATESGPFGTDCDDTSSIKTYPISDISSRMNSAVVNLVFPPNQIEESFYLCTRDNNSDMPWVHQGPDPWIKIKAQPRRLPMWLQGIFICLLLVTSGLFAGLTLGLLALEVIDLKILANTGSEKEKSYAKTILPLRTRGNYLLCSLVLGNVLVNNTLTILLDALTSGLVAVIFSTAGIVIFGEIIPQAVCSRNGLAIGAKTVWITKFLMLITFPLSYTISVILDKILGEEIGIVYNREKLKELIAVTIDRNDLETDEVNIISGALEMKKKTVEDIMTRLEDIYMLPIDGILDFETLSEIRKQGYSRIPIYEGEKCNIVSLLYTKDLVFVDPDDRIPLKTLSQFYKNTCFFVFCYVTLDIIFKEFKECQKGHMAFVQKINSSLDKDPFCETIGLVTLEDVIEELIQSEIVDETDIWTDNRSKKRIFPHPKQDFSKFIEIRNIQKTLCISPQLALAAFQFLSTAVEPFKQISEPILHRLLKKNILFEIKKERESKTHIYLYEDGKPTDSFTLILEGKVEVVAGREKLMFESGPFTYFGAPALVTAPGRLDVLNDWFSFLGDSPFIPDYTVEPICDTIVFRIRRSLYLAAVQATVLENAKTYKDSNGADVNVDPNIEEQIENMFRSVDADNQPGIGDQLIGDGRKQFIYHQKLKDDKNF